jgi:hypothetical protein
VNLYAVAIHLDLGDGHPLIARDTDTFVFEEFGQVLHVDPSIIPPLVGLGIDIQVNPVFVCGHIHERLDILAEQSLTQRVFCRIGGLGRQMCLKSGKRENQKGKKVNFRKATHVRGTRFLVRGDSSVDCAAAGQQSPPLKNVGQEGGANYRDCFKPLSTASGKRLTESRTGKSMRMSLFMPSQMLTTPFVP